MPKALTQINVGQEDGSVKVINAGEEVSGVDDNTMNQLIEAGAVEDPNAKAEESDQVIGSMEPQPEAKPAPAPAKAASTETGTKG